MTRLIATVALVGVVLCGGCHGDATRATRFSGFGFYTYYRLPVINAGEASPATCTVRRVSGYHLMIVQLSSSGRPACSPEEFVNLVDATALSVSVTIRGAHTDCEPTTMRLDRQTMHAAALEKPMRHFYQWTPCGFAIGGFVARGEETYTITIEHHVAEQMAGLGYVVALRTPVGSL